MRGLRPARSAVLSGSRSARWTRWVRRYLPQHLAAALATVVGCALLTQLTRYDAVIGTGTAAFESVAFYGVAWCRGGAGADSARSRSVELLREYGVPEAFDLLLRPALITLGVGLLPSPVVGAVLGSWLADLAFYSGAARRVSSRVA